MQLTQAIQLIAMLVVVGGFLSFLATQLIKQEKWPSTLKLILSFVMAGLFGLATAWVNGDVWTIIHAWGNLQAAEIFTFGSIIWASSTGWYLIAFKNAKWAQSLARVGSGSKTV